MKGIIKENLFVMLMPSHSHGVTFGNIELHLPIGFPLPYASEVFLQDKTVLNQKYVPIQDTVVPEQANRRPDVVRQVIYKNKEPDHPKTDPWGTPDSTGTGSEA